MPRLIINADDLGMNAQRSHGIFEAFEQGIVTSATIIATTADSVRAAKHAAEKRLPCGLHFSLTEGNPVSPGSSVPSLLTTEGSFMNREQFFRVLQEGQIDPLHIERELRAQLEWISEVYSPPTHMDSHHHVHILPAVAQVAARILSDHGIRFVRMPSEPLPPFGFEIDAEKTAFIQSIITQTQKAKAHYEAQGISSTDHFRGLALSGQASARNLRHILARLPEGTTELMVHPGSMNPLGSTFDKDPQRQTELRMLTDPLLPALLAERKIELCSYGDV